MDSISLPNSNNIIGRFYFRRTQNGNLIGEFSNNHSFRNSTESADVIGKTDSFIGEYNVTWYEENTAAFATLSITRKPNTENAIFILQWADDKGNLIYVGEGLLMDNILIGDYRDFNIIWFEK